MNVDKKIYLYGDSIGSVEIRDAMGNDKRIVEAARVSFGRDFFPGADELPADLREYLRALCDSEMNAFDPVKDARLILFLLEHFHTSPFEHCVITWRFEVPLFVRSQHHRHRTWAYNEISRRYTSEDIKFYCPKTFRTQAKSNKQASNMDEIDGEIWDRRGHALIPMSQFLEEHTNEALSFYEALIEGGVAREQARMVLPQNMYTSYFGTVNLHNAMRFLALRMDPHAQWEIRVAAEAMKDHLLELFPVATTAFLQLMTERKEAWKRFRGDRD